MDILWNGNVGIGTTSPGALLDIGLPGTTTGALRLEGGTSGYVALTTSGSAGSWTMTLPTGAGTSGYVLQTDGTGVTSWISNAGTASTALSGITAAAAAHTISNVSYAQTWNWNSLTTQTALTLASSSLTNGMILSLQNTAVSATSTGKVLNVSDTTTGPGYAVYAAMTGTGNNGIAIDGTESGANNQGAAIYGLNNSTSGWGVYSAGSSPNYFAGNVGIGTTAAKHGQPANRNLSIDRNRDAGDSLISGASYRYHRRREHEIEVLRRRGGRYCGHRHFHQ